MSLSSPAVAMSDPFASPKDRVARANQHVRALDRGITRFFKQNPYTKVVETDTNGQRQFHKLRLVKPLPDSLTDAATEAIEAMRAALDQLGYVCCRAKGIERSNYTHFPIADTAADVETALLKGRSKDIPPEIAALFRSFQPYKGGNNEIWALNRLCNHGKHRLLVPIGTAVSQIRQTGLAVPGLAIPTPTWDSEKNEIVLIIADAGVDLQYDCQISVFVALGEIEGVAGWPADGVLRRIGEEVERVVLATEAEARRVGVV